MIDTGAKAMRWITSGTISSSEHRALRYTALLFAVALLLHGVDHLRRGLEALTPEVYWGGTALTLVAAAVVLGLLRYGCAAPVALAVGLATAILTSAAHLLPRWSAFCDPFPGSDVDALSWAAVLAEDCRRARLRCGRRVRAARVAD